MKRPLKYSKEVIENAVRESISIAQVIKKFHKNVTGGLHSYFKSLITKYSIDISHFKGQGHNKGKRFGYKRPISDYLENKAFIITDVLKKRLIKESIFEHKCYKCENRTWNSQPIPIEMHHINGNNRDNRLENLQILCPNCHAQTGNYSGKNKKVK